MTLVFDGLGAKMKKALGLDDPEKDLRDQARADARVQAVVAKDEAKRSRITRSVAISDAQYRRRVRGQL